MLLANSLPLQNITALLLRRQYVILIYMHKQGIAFSIYECIIRQMHNDCWSQNKQDEIAYFFEFLRQRDHVLMLIASRSPMKRLPRELMRTLITFL
jgi:hypothetical protein